MDLKFLLPLETDFPGAFHSSRCHPGGREHQKQEWFHGDDCISSEWKREAEAECVGRGRGQTHSTVCKG